jgi:adenosylcobinamide-GDP ribazoletransferase
MKRQALLFLTAIQFLTRLPVPRFEAFEADWLAQSVRYFPLVGALAGWIGIAVWWLSSMCFTPAVAVGLMMGASLLLTGALHEDGFADACDGFGGGRTRESILAIMKDSRVGAYGAIGIAMMLGLKWSLLVSLPAAFFPAIVIGAHAASRWCATGLILRLQYVRSGEDAKSRPVAGSLTAAAWLSSGALGVLGLLPVGLLPAGLFVGAAERPALAVDLAAAMVSAVAGSLLAGRYFKNRIGGYTGDCLGAVQQISELIFILAALGLLPLIQRAL